MLVFHFILPLALYHWLLYLYNMNMIFCQHKTALAGYFAIFLCERLQSLRPHSIGETQFPLSVIKAGGLPSLLMPRGILDAPKKLLGEFKTALSGCFTIFLCNKLKFVIPRAGLLHHSWHTAHSWHAATHWRSWSFFFFFWIITDNCFCS